MEHYTVEQAALHALTWCQNHKGWIRICDLPEDFDTMQFYTTWADVPKKEKDAYLKKYGMEYAEQMWESFGVKHCKIPLGFISGKGEFFTKCTEIPHNFMMIFKIDEWRQANNKMKLTLRGAGRVPCQVSTSDARDPQGSLF